MSSEVDSILSDGSACVVQLLLDGFVLLKGGVGDTKRDFYLLGIGPDTDNRTGRVERLASVFDTHTCEWIHHRPGLTIIRQVKGSAKTKAALTRTGSSRRVSVAFLTSTYHGHVLRIMFYMMSCLNYYTGCYPALSQHDGDTSSSDGSSESSKPT